MMYSFLVPIFSCILFFLNLSGLSQKEQEILKAKMIVLEGNYIGGKARQENATKLAQRGLDFFTVSELKSMLRFYGFIYVNYKHSSEMCCYLSDVYENLSKYIVGLDKY